MADKEGRESEQIKKVRECERRRGRIIRKMAHNCTVRMDADLRWLR